MSRSLHDFFKSSELQTILPLKSHLFKEGNMNISKQLGIIITISHYWQSNLSVFTQKKTW